MSGMKAGHEAAPRWGTDGAAGVEICQPHALTGHAVNIGCLELFLTVATEVAVTCVVQHDIDKIGLVAIKDGGG